MPAKGKAKATPEESRDGVPLTHLDEPLFDGADATKRDLVDYMELMGDRIVPHLRDRPLSVIRVRAGQAPFMQKNLPSYAPDWVESVSIWADRPKRDVAYALANDRRTLVWFANQRAVEYHPGLMTTDDPTHQTHLILDLDPPSDVDAAEGFRLAVGAVHLVKQVLDEAGLAGAAKTSGAKGMHVFVPLAPTDTVDVAAANRSIAARAAAVDSKLATTAFVVEERHGKVFVDSTRAGGATVITAYSPRIRPGVPVSFPVAWADLDVVTPRDFTVRTAPGLLGDRDRWADLMPQPQTLPADLVAEGHDIPIARVLAMHEGKRRAAARRQS
jgi:bifunctional non-homologous end joining protein LigD